MAVTELGAYILEMKPFEGNYQNAGGDEAAPISFRAVCPDDESHLFELYRRLREDEMSMWGEEEQQLALLTMQYKSQSGSYRTIYPKADHRIILAGEDRVGRIMVNRSESEIVLVDITILPEYRGRGIGAHLLSELTGEATRAKVPIRLHVALENRARRLYQRQGFTSLGNDGVYEEMVWLPQGN